MEEPIHETVRRIIERIDDLEQIVMANIERIAVARPGESARKNCRNCVRRSALTEASRRHSTGWSKLGRFAQDFQWRGISVEEYLRKPQPESPELQTVLDMAVSDSYAVFRRFDERGRDETSSCGCQSCLTRPTAISCASSNDSSRSRKCPRSLERFNGSKESPSSASTKPRPGSWCPQHHKKPDGCEMQVPDR